MTIRIVHVPRANLPVWNVGEQLPRAGVDQIVPDIPHVPEKCDVWRTGKNRRILCRCTARPGGAADPCRSHSSASPIVAIPRCMQAV
jgi:hypothetical protein